VPKCNVCGQRVARAYDCNYCAGSFCSKHRLPESHACTFETSPDADDGISRRGLLGAGAGVAAVAVGAGVVTGTVSVPSLPSGAVFEDDWDAIKTARTVHQRVNDARADEGVRRLEWDDDLHSIAQNYAERMATERFYSHEDPSGDDFQDRYREAGYQCRIPLSGDSYSVGAENILQTWWGEDIERDDGTEAFYLAPDELAAGMLKTWLNSKPHRENILRPVWRREGIGVARTDDDKVFAVQNFC